jgi:hypothetical protein
MDEKVAQYRRRRPSHDLIAPARVNQSLDMPRLTRVAAITRDECLTYSVQRQPWILAELLSRSFTE